MNINESSTDVLILVVFIIEQRTTDYWVQTQAHGIIIIGVKTQPIKGYVLYMCFSLYSTMSVNFTL